MKPVAEKRPFFDSSALIKRYVAEAGTDRVNQIIGQADELIVSPITRIEITSAVARRLREGAIKPPDSRRILRQLDRDWTDVTLVTWSAKLEELARELLLRRPLRTLDAIQLASARFASCEFLVCSDQRLLDAAVAERIKTEKV